MTPAGDPPEEMEDLDPGLARERTELAWTRTAISFGALGAAIIRSALAPGILVLGTSALVWGMGRLARGQSRNGQPQRSHLLVITAAVTVVSVVALAVVFLGRAHPVVPR